MERKQYTKSAINEMLRKLEAKFGKDRLEKVEKPKKRARKDDSDSEFLSMVRETLDEAKAAQEASKRAEEPIEEATEETVEESIEEIIESPTEEVVEESAEAPVEETVEETPPIEEETLIEPEPTIEEPKPEKKPRRRSPKKKEPEPPTEEVVEVVEEPIEVVEEPIEVIEEPIEVIEEPIEVNEEPIEVIEEPIEVIEEPVEVIEEPVEVIKEPVEVIEEPVEVIEEPVEVIEEPVEVIEEPVEVIEEPVEAIEEPIESVEEPIETVEKPIEGVEEPITQNEKKVQTVKVRVREIPVTAPPLREASVSLPRRSSEFDFAKPKKESDRILIKPSPAPKVVKRTDPDAHIIRPSAHGTAAEPIVIRPQRATAPLRPTLRGAEPLPTHTVTVEAMQKKDTNVEATEKATPAKRASRASVSMPKASENEFLIKKEEPSDKKDAPAEFEKVKKPTAKKTSVKSPSSKSTTPEKAPAPRKKAAAPRRKTVQKVTVDETLHEALELENEELVRAEELLAQKETISEIVPEDQPEFTTEEAPKARTSAFRMRRAQKAKLPEEDIPVLDLIHRRSGLSEEDVTMLFELGYENELGRLVGYETMKKLRCEHLRRNSQSERRHYRTAFGYRGEEYISTKQNEEIRAAYATDRHKLLRRVLLTALLSVVLFFLDFPSLLGTAVTDFDTSYPILLPILALLCLGLAGALSYRPLYAGARSLIRFTPTPYSIASVAIPVAVFYSLIGLLPGVVLPVPVCFLSALLLFALALGDVFRITGEIRAFRILSVETEKTVLEEAAPHKKKLLRGNRIVKVINDEIEENFYRVRRTGQTTGFFRRVNALEHAALELSILIGSSFGWALLLAFVTALGRPSIGDAMTAFATGFLLSVPASAIFTFFYPLHRANAVLEKRNCALIGEEAAAEYAEDQTVIFTDTDLYTAKKHAQIAIRDGDEFRQDIRLAEVVFRKLGGTLEGLGLNSSRSYLADPPVSFLRITEAGLEAVVDSKSHILLGSTEFLQSSGIHVPTESTDVEKRRTKHTSPMYVAIDGVLRLCYEIRYTSDPDFEDTLAMLTGDGTVVAIHSYDPNLTDEFLQASRPTDEPVSVVRPGRFEAEAPQDVVDTGAVALGRRRDIALPLHAAKVIRAVRRRGFFLQIAASIAGAALSVILLLLDRSGSYTPAVIALYQSVCSTLALLSARISLSDSELDR